MVFRAFSRAFVRVDRNFSVAVIDLKLNLQGDNGMGHRVQN